MDIGQSTIDSTAAVYFLYGLTYFVMGMVLTLFAGKPSRLPLTKPLSWLAGYGIIHGIHEWLAMLGYIGRSSVSVNGIYAGYSLSILGLITLVISGVMLMRFGIELIAGLGRINQRYSLIPSMIGVGVLAVSVTLFSTSGLDAALTEGTLLTRYAIYLPGAIVSAVALYLQCRSLLDEGYGGNALFLAAASAVLLANSLATGLVVPRAGFWPASVINQEWFYFYFGFPVVYARGLLGLVFTTFILPAMRVYGLEEEALIDRAEKELLLIEEINRELSMSGDIAGVMNVALDRIKRLVSAKAGGVFIKVNPMEGVRLTAHDGLMPPSESSAQGRRALEFINNSIAQSEPIFGKITNFQESLAGTVGDKLRSGCFALVPLAAKSRYFGALFLASDCGAICDPSESHLIRTVGSQLGIAIENALLAEERRISKLLQLSLLTQRPVVDGFELGVAFKSASAGMMVGGDFYDFIQLKGGRLAIIIGDVSGKGEGAISLTVNAKITIRAFLCEGSGPALALSRANAVLNRMLSMGQFVTAMAVIFESDGSFSYACAGHPSPFAWGEECRLLEGCQGLPLGAFEGSSYKELSGRLIDGEYIVLYTDGLSELRSGSTQFGVDGLKAAVMKHRGMSAEELAHGIISTAMDFSGDLNQDDIALVVLGKVAQRSGALVL